VLSSMNLVIFFATSLSLTKAHLKLQKWNSSHFHLILFYWSKYCWET
jgi:hypothetical protein